MVTSSCLDSPSLVVANGTIDIEVAAMEQTTFISAVSKVLGLNYIISLFGNFGAAANVVETKLLQLRQPRLILLLPRWLLPSCSHSAQG